MMLSFLALMPVESGPRSGVSSGIEVTQTDGQPQAETEIVIVRGALPAKAPDRTRYILINTRTLQSQSGARLDEVLRQVPGVGLFRRSASTTANATIQGLSLRPIAPNGAGRALVTLNGVPQNDPFGGWVYWGQYDPVFLQSVEIKRGASGAGFGPMALTGALALRESPALDPSLLHVDLSATEGRKIAFRQGHGHAAAQFAISGSYEAARGDFGILARQRGPVDERQGFSFANAKMALNLPQRNGDLSLRVSAFEEQKDAGVTGGDSSAQGLDISVARQADLTLGQVSLLLFAQGRDFTNRGFSANTTRTRATPTLDQYATPASALGGTFGFKPNSALPALSLEWRSAEGETRELFRFIGNDFTRQRSAGGRQDLVGLSATAAKPIRLGTSALSLDGVLRLDYWANRDGQRRETDRATGLATLVEKARDRSGTIVSGRLSADLNDGQWRLSGYRTFRPPTLNELHRPFRVGNDVTEANAGLVPETLTGLDLDFAARGRRFGGVIAGQATLFVNRIDDPIANVTLGVGPGTFARIGFLPAGGSARERRNVGHIDAIGLETQVTWQASTNALSGYVAITLVDARVDGAGVLANLTGNRPAQAPQWSIASGITWRPTPSSELGLTLRGEGDRFEDDLNTRKLAAFGSLDVAFQYQITEHNRFFVSVENVTNARVPSGRSGDDVVAIAQGRLVRVGFRVSG